MFVPFELGFDASIVVNATEKDARTLARRMHDDANATYAVIARLGSLKLRYAPDLSASGQKGDDPDAMDVEEFGVKVSRLITGELIDFEPEAATVDHQ